jgi:hypothetical protein
MSVVTSRRGFCVAVASIILFDLGRRGAAESDPVARRLSHFFGDALSASVVGREYLRSNPSEAGAPRLVDLICLASSARRAEIGAADDETLRRLVLLQQRRDFEEGRVVEVRGWILSETECRLCALAALVSG